MTKKKGRKRRPVKPVIGWREWVGSEGEVIGIDGYGASAPGGIVAERYPGLIRDIAAEGHELACHTHTHVQLDKHTPESLRARR